MRDRAVAETCKEDCSVLPERTPVFVTLAFALMFPSLMDLVLLGPRPTSHPCVGPGRPADAESLFSRLLQATKSTTPRCAYPFLYQEFQAMFIFHQVMQRRNRDSQAGGMGKAPVRSVSCKWTAKGNKMLSTCSIYRIFREEKPFHAIEFANLIIQLSVILTLAKRPKTVVLWRSYRSSS